MPSISLYFVRHGQRIDQVDSAWAATSPCPQDPPLTAQGKLQARQTGRIIRDFAHEISSSRHSGSSSTGFTSRSRTRATATAVGAEVGAESVLTGSKSTSVPIALAKNKGNDGSQQQQQPQKWTLQRMTPPESPNLTQFQATQPQYPSHPQQQDNLHDFSPRSMGASHAQKRQHHFAIVTSPFLRCSQTAIEMAIGMRQTSDDCSTAAGASVGADRNKDGGSQRDLVTISVESGLAEWLSLEYVSEPVPDSIIVQRMQDFALSRRDHEQYYTIDWKYIAQDRQLPTWPETREDMQTRLERALNHILKSYTSSLSMAAGGSGDRDLSLVFVTHASPVNALLEACLQTPTLVPVPNCSISRCRWTPLTITDEELSPSFSSSSSGSGSDEDDMNSLLDHHHHKSALLDAMMQSRSIQTVLGEEGRWLLDYQTYTAHLDREHRR